MAKGILASGDWTIRREATTQMPTRTYRVDFSLGQAGGNIDGQRAMEQAVYKVLQTQLGGYPIYDDSYGMELCGLIGREQGYVESEVKRRIQEALLADERITQVRDFCFEPGQQSDGLAVSFRVQTIFGEPEEIHALIRLG